MREDSDQAAACFARDSASCAATPFCGAMLSAEGSVGSRHAPSPRGRLAKRAAARQHVLDRLRDHVICQWQGGLIGAGQERGSGSKY